MYQDLLNKNFACFKNQDNRLILSPFGWTKKCHRSFYYLSAKMIGIRQGYTLVELAVSILFFAIVALGLSLPFSNSVSLTVNNKNINAANNLARGYLKDTEANWGIQSNFDKGELIEVDNNYTNNGKYTVTVVSQNISNDNNGVVIIRRVNIKYKDNRGNALSDIYYDYNRPGSV